MTAAGVALFVGFLRTGVSSRPSQDDKRIAKEIGGPMPGGHLHFQEQVELIRRVQRFVLRAAPINEGIPTRHPREAISVLAAGRGLCFDRSRAIEQLLRAKGMEVRHVFILASKQRESAWSLLFDRSAVSHALTEVHTSRGWLLVDSNTDWLGIDRRDNPVSAEDIESSARPIRAPSYVFDWNHLVVYGLYSRHGDFFEPYGYPDVNYRELLYNLFPGAG